MEHMQLMEARSLLILYLAAVQEIRWLITEVKDFIDYVLLNSYDDQKVLGTGLMVSKRIKHRLLVCKQKILYITNQMKVH